MYYIHYYTLYVKRVPSATPCLLLTCCYVMKTYLSNKLCRHFSVEFPKKLHFYGIENAILKAKYLRTKQYNNITINGIFKMYSTHVFLL